MFEADCKEVYSCAGEWEYVHRVVLLTDRGFWLNDSSSSLFLLKSSVSKFSRPERGCRARTLMLFSIKIKHRVGYMIQVHVVDVYNMSCKSFWHEKWLHLNLACLTGHVTLTYRCWNFCFDVDVNNIINQWTMYFSFRFNNSTYPFPNTLYYC